jgi:3-phenylpropionate/trans-cinnamate dioxygenase ferredoxin component
MTDFVEIAGVDELETGTMEVFSLEGGLEIMLARVGDEYYASDNHCPHMGGDLWQGKLEGTIVTCPRHHSQFDLTDGRVIRWTDWSGIKLSIGKTLRSPRPLKTYKVKVEEGKILVQI